MKKLGIMQPYFFPYLGYFSLIKYTDEFVFFDTPQYISKGWVNRNRVLKQDGTDTYITVPICKAQRETAIMDIRISEVSDWKQKIYGQLAVYKKKAPNYAEAIELIRNILESEQYGSSLSQLNVKSIIGVCEYLGIEKNFDVFSQMNLTIPDVNEPDEWALYITKAMGYETYVNPPGGMSFFDRKKYRDNSINLEFLDINLVPYVQRIGHFVPGLSIIDAIMYCNKDEINQMLDNYNIC